MKDERIFQDLLAYLTASWQPLPDKPEETPEGALKALWLLVSGERRAVEFCDDELLPPLSAGGRQRLEGLLHQLIEGVPLAHLTERQCFMGIEMLVGPEALIPRKETEILGYAALELLQDLRLEDKYTKVIDVCTGCGNLALALAHYDSNCRVFAADLSSAAVDLARRNARHVKLGDRVDFYVGDLFAPFVHNDLLEEGVEMVTCNPPYISTQHIEEMPKEIQSYEPHLAFDGGPFGIAIIFRLIKEAPLYIKPGGWLGLEVGYGQGELVSKRIAQSPSFQQVVTFPDSSGIVRALFAQRT